MTDPVMTLRPVPSVPVHLDKVERILNAGAWRLGEVPVHSLRIDTSYQRDFSKASEAHIARLAQGFDWAKFAPIIVAPVPDDRFAIIDGQHRTAAARARGIRMLPAYILDITQREQAAAFAAINGNVQPMSSLHVWKAALAAQEPWAIEMKQVCDQAGVSVLTYPKKADVMRPGETMCVTILRKGIERLGADAAAIVLAALRTPVNRHLSPGSLVLRCLFSCADDFEGEPHRVAAALGQADIAAMFKEARREAVEAEIAPETMLRALMIDAVREYQAEQVQEAAQAAE